MFARRRAPGLALFLCLPACEGKVRDGDAPPPASAQEAPDEPATAVDPVTCLVGNQIPDRERETVEGHANRVITGLRGGAAQPLWNDVHPDLRRPDRHEGFLAALGGLQERLRGSDAEATVAGSVVVRVMPGVREKLRIRCGRATSDPADDMYISTPVDGESIALVRLEVPGPAVVESLVVRLQKRDDAWYLVSVEGNPVRIGESDAAEFEKKGDGLRDEGAIVPAYLMYGLAQTLSGHGTGVVTAAGQRINDKLKAIAESKAFEEATRSVKTTNGDLEIIRLGLRTSPAGVAPNIKYVTRHGLDDGDGITAEAGALVRAFQAQHPVIADVFDTALVEAYRERPTDLTRAYDAFQTVVTLRKPDSPAAGG